MKCQICASENLEEFLNLGMHPPPLVLRPLDQLEQPDTRYPLALFRCGACGLIQIGYTVDPKLLFIDYAYTSGASKSFSNHLQELSESVTQKFSLTQGDLVVDIGSNDGTSLQGYLKNGVKALGVEPSKVAKFAIDNGVPTVNKFFDLETAKSITKSSGKARIVTAFNVFAHVDKLDSFMKGVEVLLAQDGVFLTESHYLLDLVQKNEFDAVYHDHLRYYSLRTISNLLHLYGLEVFDAERIPTHGGSIRVYACRKKSKPISPGVESLLKLENEEGLDKMDTYRDFAARVEAFRINLKILLWKLKGEHKRIVGISAPARSSTLLNFCGLGPDILDYVVETSPLKIGKYTPGTYIPIVDENRFFEDEPDYALLLSWHLAEDLIPKLKEGGFSGRFIVPLPRLEIR
ncbi:MAG: class I SAM-dependent methyltransferase [Nitrososphaerota archaeon]|nr:class I SAM-dependent methyltransferase [Nitrososphaerota archaeon]